MKSQITAEFRAYFVTLPEHVQRQAREAYRLFAQNPEHPGLRFRRVRDNHPTHSIRIGLHYRALGYFEGETIVWVWIGSHAEYDRRLARR